jgi:hypothetical protein
MTRTISCSDANAIGFILPAGMRRLLVAAIILFLLIPVETRYWPDWLGVGLLAAIGLQFVCSRWRPSLKLAFHRRLPRIALPVCW